MILDLRFFRNFVYYIGDRGESVGAIKFTKDVNMEDYRKQENKLVKKEFDAFAQAFDLRTNSSQFKSIKERKPEDEKDEEEKDEEKEPILGRMRDVRTFYVT